jgi:hypothetical protein
MLTMYDTVTVDTVPADAQYVAGYVGGSWPTFEPLRRRFPHARALSIAPEANMDAECLDVEPFDATNTQAPAWFSRQKARGILKPVFYTSASNVQALVNTLAAAGIHRSEYLIWSAHFTYSPHVCAPGGCGYPQADGTQWTDHALGRNLDQSLLLPAFFGPPAPPADPHHYSWFEAFEIADVKEYDKLRALGHGRFIHPHHAELVVLRKRLRHRAESIWVRAHFDPKTGKRLVGPVDWAIYHRGWRFQQLAKRANGQQLVK